MATQDIGDRLTYTGTFTSTAGVAVDPTTVTFMIREPDGTETSWVYGVDAEVLRTGTGVYTFAAVTFDATGVWCERWKSEGVLWTAIETTTTVRKSCFATP